MGSHEKLKAGIAKYRKDGPPEPQRIDPGQLKSPGQATIDKLSAAVTRELNERERRRVALDAEANRPVKPIAYADLPPELDRSGLGKIARGVQRIKTAGGVAQDHDTIRLEPRLPGDDAGSEENARARERAEIAVRLRDEAEIERLREEGRQQQ